MNQNSTWQSAVSETAAGQSGSMSSRVLLLGDDGRMAKLLDRVNAQGHDHQVQNEPSVLNGIVELGREQYHLVLLNAEQLCYKTSNAAAALRCAAPTARLILYGQAHAEVYAQPALRNNADDFLTWPIPTKQIKELLNGKTTGHKIIEPPNSRYPVGTAQDGNASQALQAELLEDYHQLALLIPQGSAVLVERAQKILADLLNVKQVRIYPQTGTGDATMPDGDNRWNVRLIGPTGPAGKMLLELSGAEPDKAVVRQVAAFIGTLLFLTRRDENLKQLAIIDELTGAYNRRYIEYFMRQVLKQSQHEDTEVTMLLFDIDDFKHFNDTYSHSAGDEILRQATRLIKSCCREHDVVARIGGDEFAVLFWDTGFERTVLKRDDQDKYAPPARTSKSHSEMVEFMSNRFRRMMNTNIFPGLGPEARGVLTISGGLARFPWDGQTVDELIKQADNALLRAKQYGKNRIYLIGQPEQR